MLRGVLAVLNLVVAISGTGGGIYLIVFPDGLPKAWFENPVFSSTLIPGILLLLVVSGSAWVATLGLLRRRPLASVVSLTAGVILVVWIVVQIALIGLSSFLQPLFFVVGLIVTVLSWLLWRRQIAEFEKTPHTYQQTARPPSGR